MRVRGRGGGAGKRGLQAPLLSHGMVSGSAVVDAASSAQRATLLYIMLGIDR